MIARRKKNSILRALSFLLAGEREPVQNRFGNTCAGAVFMVHGGKGSHPKLPCAMR